MRETLHRVTNWLLLGLAIAIGAGIISLAGMPTPVRAALNVEQPMPEHAPAVCLSWDEALNTAPPGVMVEIIPDESLPAFLVMIESTIGRPVGNVTRAFAGFVPPYIIVGLERDGCLLEPIVLTPA